MLNSLLINYRLRNDIHSLLDTVMFYLSCKVEYKKRTTTEFNNRHLFFSKCIIVKNYKITKKIKKIIRKNMPTTILLLGMCKTVMKCSNMLFSRKKFRVIPEQKMCRILDSRKNTILFSFVDICIAVGDPVIKKGCLGSH